MKVILNDAGKEAYRDANELAKKLNDPSKYREYNGKSYVSLRHMVIAVLAVKGYASELKKVVSEFGTDRLFLDAIAYCSSIELDGSDLQVFIHTINTAATIKALLKELKLENNN